MDILLKLRYLFTLPLLILTLLTTPAASSTDTAELVDTDTFVFDQALIMGQGITTDGEYFYTSGTITALDITALAKYTVEDMSFVESKLNPLPDACKDRGNNHIGGISYYNGKIYASVEGGDVVPACIVVFDCETLEPTGEVYDLPGEFFTDGVPWCAVDKETGLLYASEWSEVTSVFVFDVNDSMSLVREISLTGIGMLDRIQGGEFYNGELYFSHDVHGKGNIKNIMKLDVETGEVSVVAERNVGSDNIEAEGLTFVETADGAQMHVLDYNKLIGIFVHHYKVDF